MAVAGGENDGDPAATAAAIAAASAWFAALSAALVPVSLPQLQVMMCGFSPPPC